MKIKISFCNRTNFKNCNFIFLFLSLYTASTPSSFTGFYNLI